MFRFSKVLLTPCSRCKWAWFFPLESSGSYVKSGRSFNVVPVKSRYYNSKPESKLAVSVLSTNDVSLSDSVTQSRQGCDSSNNAVSESTSGSASVNTSDHVLPINESRDDYQIPSQKVSEPDFKMKRRRKDTMKTAYHNWIQPEGYDTGITIYNSLTKSKVPLILPKGRVATWYACGPTVYDQAHIGHASAYIFTDVIRRILTKIFGIDVVLVMGITDIDDKIIARSTLREMDFRVLAREHETSFLQDLNRLNILPPTVKTRVSDFVPRIIQFIQGIIDQGYAYRVPSGSVYFDKAKFTRDGHNFKFVKPSLGSDGNAFVGEKLNPSDFALWKAAKPGEPYWESPWGRGRPGWHIECSTMSTAVCGEKLDMHSGGIDLMFPHHECEIAQSEAFLGCHQWTNYWIHTGHLCTRPSEGKMSKSLGNTIGISEILETYTADEFRLFTLQKQYRKTIEFNDEKMQIPVSTLKIYENFVVNADAYVRGQSESQPIDEPYLLESLERTRVGVEDALADDFNTPGALNLISSLIYKTNLEMGKPAKSQVHHGVRNTSAVAAISQYVQNITSALGLHIGSKEVASDVSAQQQFEDVVNNLTEFRGKIRDYAKNAHSHIWNEDSDYKAMNRKERKKAAQKAVQPLWRATDELRENLKLSGITIKDRQSGYSWEVKRKNFNEKEDKKNGELTDRNE